MRKDRQLSRLLLEKTSSWLRSSCHPSDFQQQKTCQFLQLTSSRAAAKIPHRTNSKETIMARKIFVCFVLTLAFAAAGSSVFAQKETANGVDVEKDLELLRRNLRSEKKQLIALNVTLTDAEATKFWPVYDQYVAEMAKHNDEF